MSKVSSRRVCRLAVVAVLAVGCEEPATVLPYQSVAVVQRDIVVTASAAGSVEPIQTVEVKSKASGEIIEVAVQVGDVVQRDDLLVRVDQRIPRNAVVQAEADLNVAQAELSNAESQLERSRQLYQSQAITEQEFETARLAHASARAQLVRAERTLEDARIAFEDTEVRAASGGTILTRQVEVGTVIQSASSGLSGGAVLLTMANLDTVQVRTLVDETDIGKIRSGLPVVIRVDAYPNQPFQGDVLKIEPQSLVEQNVTMFPVLIRIANEGARLRPGMNAEVEIRIGRREGVAAVPNAALRTRSDAASAARVLGLDPKLLPIRDEMARVPASGSPPSPSSEFANGGEYIVFTLQDGMPGAVPIRTGLTDLDYSEVLEGLTVGDTVLLLSSDGLVQTQRERPER